MSGPMDDERFDATLRAFLAAEAERAAAGAPPVGGTLDRLWEAGPPPRRALASAWLLIVLALLLTAALATSLALGSGLIKLSVLVSPSPSATASPVPSISTQTGTTLDLQPLRVGPPAGAWVVAWSGGYLALWQSGAPHYHLNDDYLVGAGPLYAWVSGDGRVWTLLPVDTFGSVVDTFGATPLGGGVVVSTKVITKSEFSTTAWLSKDGTTWTSNPAPAVTLTGGLYPWPPSEVEDNEVAGGPRGAVALSSTSNGIEFSPDGQVWQTATLPGDGFEVAGVQAFGTGFVAFGISGSNAASNPVAWWSEDGLHWTATGPITRPGEGFLHVMAGAGGLVAESWGGQLSPLHSLWTSRDGRSWTLSADSIPSGQGGGPSAGGGWLEGDGTRLLWYSVPGADPTTYFTSLDGISWTQLNLTGDTAAATTGQATPFLMRDGILFIGENGAWFGSVAE